MKNHFKENLDYLTHEEKFNCNVAELAKKLNVTRQSIRYYTIGRTKPSLDNLIKICEIYDISKDYEMPTGTVLIIVSDIEKEKII